MAISVRHNGQIPTGPIMALMFAVSTFTLMLMQMTEQQAAACAPLFTGIIVELIARLFRAVER